LLQGYFPAQLKSSQIIFILKARKSANGLTTYRPISFLLIVSNVFEKLLLRRLLPKVGNNGLMPNRLQAEALLNRTDRFLM
jgi:hypothetical protein